MVKLTLLCLAIAAVLVILGYLAMWLIDRLPAEERAYLPEPPGSAFWGDDDEEPRPWWQRWRKDVPRHRQGDPSVARPGREARRDGMGAQGEPATGAAYAPGANTIPPRTLWGKIVSRPGSSEVARDGSGLATMPDLAGPGRSDDRCSSETEVSCRDAACPIHGDDGTVQDMLDGLVAQYVRTGDEFLGHLREATSPGTDLVLASPPLPWGDDDTLTTMLAVHARHKKVAMADAVRRTEAVLARAERVLAGAAA